MNIIFTDNILIMYVRLTVLYINSNYKNKFKKNTVGHVHDKVTPTTIMKRSGAVYSIRHYVIKL